MKKKVFPYFEVFSYVKIKYVGELFIGLTNKKKQMFLTSDGLGNFKLQTLQKFQTYHNGQ